MDYSWEWAWAGHGLSFAALLGVLAGVFTPFAALATGAWFSLQIYESKTMQDILKRRRARKIARMRLALEEAEGRQAED